MLVVARYCNVCDSNVDDALPSESRSDHCPECGLRMRHRAYKAMCNIVGDPTKGALTAICHASPAEMRYLFPEAKGAVNFDIRPLPFIGCTMDIQEMHELPDGSQDVFVALHVLHHVRDDIAAVDAIGRVLKRHGTAIFTVPFWKNVRTKKYSNITDPYGAETLQQYGVGTFRRYGFDDFISLLERRFFVSAYTFSDPLTGESSTAFLATRT